MAVIRSPRPTHLTRAIDHALHAALLLSAALALPQAASAQQLSWDGSDPGKYDNGVVDGGNGVWDSSGRNWTATGATNQAWQSGAVAVFTGPATVDIVGEQAIGGLKLQSATTLSSNGGGSLRLASTDPLGTIIDVASGSARIDAAISGGRLTVGGNGTLILTGKNSYDGLSISSGSVVGNADSIRGRVAGQRVEFAQATDAAFDGAVITAYATKSGAGTLRLLSSSSSYWSIDSGTLIARELTGPAQVAANAVLRFEGSGHASQIYGAGQVQVAAGGSDGFDLSLLDYILGRGERFTGTVVAESGRVRLSANTDGSVLIRPGALLFGSIGRAVDLDNYGTLAINDPNLPPSTSAIFLVGDYTHRNGATLSAALTPTSVDLIQTQGRAILLGGTVDIRKVPGQYANSARYTLINAAQGVTGEFAALTQDLPFLNLHLAYDSNHVYLDILRSRTRFADVCTGFNQCQLARNIDGASDSGALSDDMKTVVDEMTTLSAAQAMAGLDTMTGEAHASLAGAALGNLGGATSAIARHLSGLNSREDGRSGVWLQARDADARYDGDGNARGYDLSASGAAFGADSWLGERWLLGGSLGTGRNTLDFEGPDRAKSEIKSASLYSAFQNERAYVRGVLDFARAKNKVDREISVGSIRRQTHAEYDSDRTALYAEAGLNFAVGASTLQPLLSAEHVRLNSDGFREHGAQDLDLVARAQRLDRTTVGAGLRWSGQYGEGAWRFAPAAELRWLHDSGDTTAFGEMALAGTPDAWSRIDGLSASPDRGQARLGFKASREGGLELAIGYDYQHAGRVEAHSADLSIGYRW